MLDGLENIPEGEGDAILFVFLQLSGLRCHSDWWTQMHIRFAMEKKTHDTSRPLSVVMVHLSGRAAAGTKDPAWLLHSLRASVLEKQTRSSSEAPDPLLMAPEHTMSLSRCCGASSRLSSALHLLAMHQKKNLLDVFESAPPLLKMVDLLEALSQSANCGAGTTPSHCC